MSLHDINSKINELANNWEKFKEINNARLKDIELKGSSDPLTENHLKNLNNNMDSLQEEVQEMRLSIQRPQLAQDDISPYQSTTYREYGRDFANYIRKGNEIDISRYVQKDMSIVGDNGNDGGHLAPPFLQKEMIARITELSPMRQICNVTSISSHALEIIEDRGGLESAWVGEVENRNTTETPKISKRSIATHEMYAQPRATQKLLDDAHIKIESWLSEKIIERMSQLENESFVNGNGEGRPRGFLSYPDGGDWNQIARIAVNNINADAIFRLFYSLKELYSTNGTFLMNRELIQHVRSLRDDGNHRYLWQPSLEKDTPNTLLGAKVVAVPDMQGIAQGNICIAFGDFKRGYCIVDRHGIRVMRDPYTEKPYVKFYATKRVGGDVVNTEAIKLLAIAGQQ